MGRTVNVLSTAAFEEGHFQTGFEAEKNLEYHVEVWEWKSRSQVVCMRIKARFLYLLSLMRGTVMRPASTERREREG